MTRVGGPTGHHHISDTPSGNPKGSSLHALPSQPSSVRHSPIPLSEISKFFLPESISPSEACRKASIKKDIDAIVSMITLIGLKDGISGSG